MSYIQMHCFLAQPLVLGIWDLPPHSFLPTPSLKYKPY